MRAVSRKISTICKDLIWFRNISWKRTIVNMKLTPFHSFHSNGKGDRLSALGLLSLILKSLMSKVPEGACIRVLQLLWLSACRPLITLSHVAVPRGPFAAPRGPIPLVAAPRNPMLLPLETPCCCPSKPLVLCLETPGAVPRNPRSAAPRNPWGQILRPKFSSFGDF